jgi:hypothetical protein
MYVSVKPRPHTRTKCGTEVSSSEPHFLQLGLLLSPIIYKCLLKVLCPVSRPITLDCVLLKDNSEAAVHTTIRRYLVPIPNRCRAYSHYTWSSKVMFLIHLSEERQASRDSNLNFLFNIATRFSLKCGMFLTSRILGYTKNVSRKFKVKLRTK